MEKLTDEYARVLFEINQPELRHIMTEKEERLIDMLQEYDDYLSFSSFFDALFDIYVD